MKIKNINIILLGATLMGSTSLMAQQTLATDTLQIQLQQEAGSDRNVLLNATSAKPGHVT